MTSSLRPRLLISVNKEPDTVECREIDTIPRRTTFLSGLLRRNGDEDWTAGYIRARSSSVQIGLHGTMESDYDGSDVREGEEPVEIVRPSCPETYRRCATCILNLTPSELNGVEPQLVIDGLCKLTTPYIPNIAVD